MSELLPCPFCGGEPDLRGHKAPEFWVGCSQIGCKATTEGFGDQARAIAAWNTRANADHITRLESDVALWKREAEARSEGMVGLNLDRAAMGVEIMQLRELVERSLAAINAGIAMADAEWRNHDSAVDRNDKIIREYRYDAREALSRISSAPDSGAPADAVQALVSDQAAARLAPSGFDPSRENRNG